MSAAVEISVESPLWSAVADLAGLVGRAVDRALEEADAGGLAGGELSFLFCDDAAIQGLNARWRGIAAPTNVLSFPAPRGTGTARPDGGPVQLGDVALAFETVEREARRDGRTLEDHLSHLVVHGVLHLLGHDHDDEAEALAMERLETRVMARLGRPDPHADDDGPAPP